MKEINKDDKDLIIIDEIDNEEKRKIHKARYNQAVYEMISEIENLDTEDIRLILNKYDVKKIKGSMGGYRICLEFPEKRPFPNITK